jgi:hypothetical protein
MTEIELIGGCGRLEAVVLHGRISVELRKALYDLLPSRARLSAELASRWRVFEVLCDSDWEHAQLHRVPMLPVRGLRLCLAGDERPLRLPPPVAVANKRAWRSNVWRGR